MALIVADRVKETTNSTGTGTYALGGASNGFQAFSAVTSNTDTVYYAVSDGVDFEVGVGTYATSGNSIARTTILSSSNSGSAVNWGVGTKDIFLTYPAEKAVVEDVNNNVTIGNNLVVGGTVDGVDIAARDAVLTSTTTTANAALPKAGGTMSGNLILNANPTIALQSATKQYVDTIYTAGTGLSISGTEFSLVTPVSSATALATGRTIGMTGDVVWTSASFDGTGNVTGTAAIQPNSVALGTDTTGNYVSAGATSGAGISGSVSSEGGTFTVTSNATDANTASTIVARDASGNFAAGAITATSFTGDITGNADTATALQTSRTINGVSFNGTANITVADSTKLPLGGGAMTGAITTNSTFDGRDVSVDGSKLDGIETNADVTDVTNVTAAGALMDSEVTNLAQVKAFSSADYATAAQGTLAANALPKSGGALTGAVTTSSTFDGRDVSVDGAKLDGIATSANNYSLPLATTTVRGGIELYSNTDQTVVPNTVTATAGRTYGLQLNSANQAMVNVPWINTTYSVGDGGLTQINFTSADNTKLDGIEAGADVTDTTNVTDAGALMDSEVDADIKTFVLPANTTISTFGASLVDDANAATARTTLGVAIGSNVQAYSSILQNTTASFLSADETKLDYISVTQAVDLDQMETDIAALANGMVYKGNWDASSGSFPGGGSAQTGWFYYVSVAGTVGGVSFAIGDNIVATTDNASASTFAGNWSKHDQTDAVQAVVGLTGSIAKSALLSALNVEDGADVTDTTNVTAAGALMDSEVTNLAQVKAFSAADYATAAQGTLATNALPKSGGALTGAVTTSSTFDGRNVSVDGGKLDGIETGATADQTAAQIKTAYESNANTNEFSDAEQTKLSGIEASADVTDTTNVTAAGALMDSEVTNLAQVKAFSSADYATAAQGTLAANALPKSGGALTGAVTTSSTFDGRDVSVDGAKLDGIATGATNVTNNNQLTNGAGYITSYVNTTYSAGTALDLSGTTFNVDLSELSTSTASGDGDYFVVVDALNAQRKLTKGNINNSGFNNDAGYTTNVGDITGVTAGSGISGGGTSGTVTVSHDNTSSQSSVNNSGATVIQDVTLDTYGHVTALGSHTLTLANLGYTGATNANYITNNNQLTNGAGYTTNVGDITGVTAGTNLNGGGTSGGVTVNLDNTITVTTVNAGTFNTTSDERAKKDIAPITGALGKVQQLGGYSFTLKATDEKSSGVIAQEVQKVMPELVQEGGEGHLTVQYGNMVGLLIEAIKEQQAQIDALTAKLNG
ncbi:tail fiber domain-containing protein [bacterium]|nr:tail fiber domain-containing protein [bacterium]